MYNYTYTVEEKLSLMLIMYDFSWLEKISLSELLIMIKSVISVYCKIEKIEDPIRPQDIEAYIEIVFEQFIKQIFEKRKEDWLGA